VKKPRESFIVHDDREETDLLHVIVGPPQRVFACFLAYDDFDDPHLVDGAEKMQADEAGRILAEFGEDRDRQGRGIRTIDASLGQHGEGLRDHLPL
jgi:hypothetical protein